MLGTRSLENVPISDCKVSPLRAPRAINQPFLPQTEQQLLAWKDKTPEIINSVDYLISVISIRLDRIYTLILLLSNFFIDVNKSRAKPVSLQCKSLVKVFILFCLRVAPRGVVCKETQFFFRDLWLQRLPFILKGLSYNPQELQPIVFGTVSILKNHR